MTRYSEMSFSSRGGKLVQEREGSLVAGLPPQVHTGLPRELGGGTPHPQAPFPSVHI